VKPGIEHILRTDAKKFAKHNQASCDFVESQNKLCQYTDCYHKYQLEKHKQLQMSNLAIEPSVFLAKESTVPARIGIYQGLALFGFPHM
jgi:hypothetical protein